MTVYISSKFKIKNFLKKNTASIFGLCLDHSLSGKQATMLSTAPQRGQPGKELMIPANSQRRTEACQQPDE